MQPCPAYTPGSREDFDRLYRDSHARILRTLVVVLRDAAAAEDCAQECFARAYAAWPRWQPDAPAEAWLHRIALNVAISHRRREGLRGIGALLTRLGPPPAGEAPLEPAGTLVAALRRLRPKQAVAVVLRFHHGYSNREIAVALGVPETTVASRLVAAKAQLRALLEEAARGEETGEMVTSAA